MNDCLYNLFVYNLNIVAYYVHTNWGNGLSVNEKEIIMFTIYNTEGYTQEQLDALNAEWEARAADLGLEQGTEEYDFQEKNFSDEVSRR